MERFRIRFLCRGLWLATVICAQSDQHARDEFRRLHPCAIILGVSQG